VRIEQNASLAQWSIEASTTGKIETNITGFMAKLTALLENWHSKSDSSTSRTSSSAVDNIDLIYQSIDYRNIGSEGSVLLFNTASLLFSSHRYAASKRLLNGMLLNSDALDDVLVIRTCFLHIEILLQEWLVVKTTTTSTAALGKKRAELQEQVTKLLSETLAKATSNITQACSNQENEEIDGKKPRHIQLFQTNPQQLQLFLTFISFKKHLYECRLQLLFGRPKQSKKEIKNALEIFQRELKPISESEIAVLSGAENGLSPAAASCIVRGGGVLCSVTPLSTLERQNQVALNLKV
jgi:CCR4-NOT transcription complex subunit 10